MYPKTQFVIVPEYIVMQGAEACKDDENNGFNKVLSAGNEFKSAGMTPIYILDENTRDLVVVAKETFQKKLN